jgi:stearoyl-CoA desaturase (delta-9 desaturase)
MPLTFGTPWPLALQRAHPGAFEDSRLRLTKLSRPSAVFDPASSGGSTATAVENLGESGAGTARRSWARLSVVPFVIFHAMPVLVVFTGVTRRAVFLAVVCYLVRLVAITAGYHRYFSHRTYRIGRTRQFLLALIGLTAVQRGPLWWAGNHRAHHRYSDSDRDPHSAARGFWWSHVGWILSAQHANANHALVPDLAKYPELRFIDRHDWIGPCALGVGCFLLGGWSGLIIGFFASTIVLWHVTFMINSLAHIWGRQPYATNDTSRNSLALALLTFGEGWHNNHHHNPTSCRQGFRWYQIDITYVLLRAAGACRLVTDIRAPSTASLAARTRQR